MTQPWITRRKANDIIFDVNGKLPTISLYTGAGGMDYGFEAAGFETGVGLELDQDAVETVRLNRSWPVICQDIHKTSTVRILEAAGLHRGDAALLIGGPPCQPFSKSGYWSRGDSRRLDDPRAKTLDAYMRVVREALPEVFVLENVHGIKYSGKEEGMLLLQRLVDEINAEHKTNYVLSWDVLNAADYGVPQLRNRFFMVGHRDGKRFTFPSPAYQSRTVCQETNCGTQPYVTAWDAIGDLCPDPAEDLRARGRWADLLPSIPEGENYLWHTDRKGGLPLFGWRRRYWSFLLKLAKDRPSWTIQAQPGPAIGPFHWESRLLSIREMARLQTFPDNIRFVGSRNSLQRQIGNAVPSLLAEVLGREIRRQLFGAPLKGELTLAICPKRPIPEPEPVESVAEKYLNLVGEHVAHPGTGKGPNGTR
ncbi:MAG: DNA cytosine methyltransferase [Trueperaceae bacterium]